MTRQKIWKSQKGRVTWAQGWARFLAWKLFKFWVTWLDVFTQGWFWGATELDCKLRLVKVLPSFWPHIPNQGCISYDELGKSKFQGIRECTEKSKGHKNAKMLLQGSMFAFWADLMNAVFSTSQDFLCWVFWICHHERSMKKSFPAFVTIERKQIAVFYYT